MCEVSTKNTLFYPHPEYLTFALILYAHLISSLITEPFEIMLQMLCTFILCLKFF